MRCNNCGWENPVGSGTCQKCNRPLSGSGLVEPIIHKEQVRPFTVLDTCSSGVSGIQKIRICSKCKYPATNYSDVCPNCGAALTIKVCKYKLVPAGPEGQVIPLFEGEPVEVGGLKYVFQLNKP